MRLLHAYDLKFSKFNSGSDLPKYAIASHRWLEKEESSFAAFQQGYIMESDSFKKIEAFAKYVRENIKSVEYLWIDTCCINQDSTAELSEAVNLMFEWYQNAEICLAHLADVQTVNDYDGFEASVWFRRGWTLQELLAPRTVVFLTEAWQVIGNKGAARHQCVTTYCGPGLESRISKITGIPQHVLHDYDASLNTPRADKMKWMAGRKTTREEDESYALYGILGVSPGANYGEKSTGARLRLSDALQQKERVAAPPRMALALRHPDVMAFIFTHGVDLEAKDREGFTALSRFAYRGEAEAVRTLLDMGADIEAKGNNSQTPLMNAAEHNNEEIVKLLLERGANVHERNTRGSTPLLLTSGHGHTRVAEILLDYRADINAWNQYHFTALHECCDHGGLGMASMLLRKGANFRLRNSYGHASIHQAARNGHVGLVREMLDLGDEVDSLTAQLETPLAEACAHGQPRIVEFLLSRGADINARDQNLYTPLCRATLRGQLRPVKILLEAGADVSVQNKDGWSPCHEASFHGHTEVLRHLLDYIAAENGNDASGNGETRREYGPTKSDRVLNLRTKEGFTPLCLAARFGQSGSVRMLVRAGADVSAQNMDGWSSIHEASSHGYTEILRVLLNHSTEREQGLRTEEGQTAYDLAIAGGHEEVARMLTAVSPENRGLMKFFHR